MISESLLLEPCRVLVDDRENSLPAMTLLTSRIDEKDCFEVLDVYQFGNEVFVKVEVKIPDFSQTETMGFDEAKPLGELIKDLSESCEEQRRQYLKESQEAEQDSPFFRLATPKQRRDAAGITSEE